MRFRKILRITNLALAGMVVAGCNAFPGKLFPGKVTSISPSADPKTHTFTVVVQPEDTSGALRAGMFVNLAITVASFPNATLVPNAAVVQRGSQSVVFVIANNVAHLQPVTLGISDDQHTQILQGVSVGQEVATMSQANLNDGSPVRIAGQSPGQQPGGSGTGRPAGAGTNRTGGSRPAGSSESGAARATATATPTSQPNG